MGQFCVWPKALLDKILHCSICLEQSALLVTGLGHRKGINTFFKHAKYESKQN